MKKAEYILVIFTVILCIFVCGFLIGRNMNRSSITVVEATSGSSGSTSGKININSASVEELTLLPGIGTSLAKRIVEYRTTVGRFRTVTDLCNVQGIGDQKLQSIIDYITT